MHVSAAPSGMPSLIPNSFASLVESGKTNGLKHQAQYHSRTNSTLQETPGKGEASGGAKTSCWAAGTAVGCREASSFSSCLWPQGCSSELGFWRPSRLNPLNTMAKRSAHIYWYLTTKLGKCHKNIQSEKQKVSFRLFFFPQAISTLFSVGFVIQVSFQQGVSHRLQKSSHPGKYWWLLACRAFSF